MSDPADPGLRVVIAGAGHAGGAVAAMLRQFGHAGPITLIGEEPVPPYQRPPLSKAWLKGEADAESVALKPAGFYADSRIDLRTGHRVARIARGRREVELWSGEAIPYDRLILATGMRPNRLSLPGADLKGVHTLRTLVDADALKAELGPGKRLAIIGGGYIGLEVAGSARALGASVVVLERESRLLARSACQVLSSFFQTAHEAEGVAFRLGAAVSGFVGEAGRVTGVALADGEVIACDVVLVGVGSTPNLEIAAEAGLDVDGGVLVDADARTSDPEVFAIGDVSRRPVPIYGRMFRLESVPSALEQARQAVHAITGRPAPPAETPWNWSDQYDLKLQMAGLAVDADHVLVRGDPATRRFAVFHLQGNRIQAVEAINAPAEFMMGRQLIGSRAEVSRDRLADPSRSMKEAPV